MEAKKKLWGRRERIDDDLTEEERKARWKVEREAAREREGGKKVQVGYMKIWVNGKVRRWDELRERWVDEQGKRRVRERGEGEEVEVEERGEGGVDTRLRAGT